VQEDGRTIDWSNISKAIKDAWDKGNYEDAVRITWIVQPNDYADRDKLAAKYLPWASCYFETEASQPVFLKESGFRTFPLMVPRWDITGEDSYGTDSPGMTALGDIKQLQIEQRRKGQLLHKAVDPPAVRPVVAAATEDVATGRRHHLRRRARGPAVAEADSRDTARRAAAPDGGHSGRALHHPARIL
jgi:hypothetical protein